MPIFTTRCHDMHHARSCRRSCCAWVSVAPQKLACSSGDAYTHKLRHHSILVVACSFCYRVQRVEPLELLCSPLMDSQRMLPTTAAAIHETSMPYARTYRPAAHHTSLSFGQQLMSSHRSLVHASVAAQQRAVGQRKGSASVNGGHWDASLSNVVSKPRQKPSGVLSPRQDYTACASTESGCSYLHMIISFMFDLEQSLCPCCVSGMFARYPGQWDHRQKW